ncbi:hypothetical protein BDP27DRAFT_1411177, partial [Rhodocollybia butyracea]
MGVISILLVLDFRLSQGITIIYPPRNWQTSKTVNKLAARLIKLPISVKSSEVKRRFTPLSLSLLAPVSAFDVGLATSKAQTNNNNPSCFFSTITRTCQRFSLFSETDILFKAEQSLDFRTDGKFNVQAWGRDWLGLVVSGLHRHWSKEKRSPVTPQLETRIPSFLAYVRCQNSFC